ncbi:N-terminal nucleophile aminohydrolase [Conidiobolus coronatus NRRL 28638]|uniref:N-terminal nucleophile aminohydrolase n=1 Tax=Conidiobolus coronatus (strain ATCC 28846 / CBS 209.66 / NRRL 28638) TaxID=796925 RepID=A0A137PA91_CONC2|nr:N-terminal nucleophile aminohydrolase [Conidiobolus coronatus NRRL 28638]|eukprot:KXN71929.1 N-terminal nucleophile aminohydrolase [Conidiobolus coronatus NRRL 28638]
MMATDCLASYGSLARFRNERRMHPVGTHTVLGAGGDISDYQYVQHLMDQLMTEENYYDDGHVLGAPHIYEYLCRIMYNRRSKVDPLWNSYIVGGVHKDERFLACVDLKGSTYKSNTLATGFGAHLAQPILRRRAEGREDELTEEEAKDIIEECMRVLFYRDARSLNKIQVSTITKDGAKISEPYSLSTEWGFAESVRGYGSQRV